MTLADGPIELPALRRLLDVIGGDHDDLSELIDDFLSGAPELVAQMRLQPLRGTPRRSPRAAHPEVQCAGLRRNAARRFVRGPGGACARGPCPEAAASVAVIAEEEEMARRALGALNVKELEA
jgi:hypothetical protein